jgi:hypothetical protein
LPEEFFESPRKLNNFVIPLSSHLNRLGLSFKAAIAIDSSQQEENGGIEMTRLPFTTIAYACTTRTDSQSAHYSDPRWADPPFSIAVELFTTSLIYGWQQRARFANSVT